MKKNKVSIIIPVYKVEPYIDECLNSIVNQTYSNLEIILVDDGSPDTCPQKCDEWASKDSRIRVVHKQNGGLSSARNAGMDVATGDFFMFVDSDDFIESNMVESLLDIHKKQESDITCCEVNRVIDGIIKLQCSLSVPEDHAEQAILVISVYLFFSECPAYASPSVSVHIASSFQSSESLRNLYTL